MDKTNGKMDDKVVDIVKKKSGAKWMQELTETGGENNQSGDISKFVRMAMTSLSLPPIDISDPHQVEMRIIDYFNYCAENDRKPQLAGMANWLGVSRDTLNSWKRGEYRSETHSDIIKRAINIIEEMQVDMVQSGRLNPVAFIFLAKNGLQMVDSQQIVVTPNNPMQDLDADAARKRLVESIPDDDE